MLPALSGFLANRTKSSQAPYTLGLLSLAASTLAFAFGRSMPVLMVGRAFQGLSSAAVWTAGLVILTQASGKKNNGRMMGYVNAAAASGYMSGPAVGGLVYDFAGYYPVYGVAFALLVLDIVLRLAMILPQSKSKPLVHEPPPAPSSDRPSHPEPTEHTRLLSSPTPPAAAATSSPSKPAAPPRTSTLTILRSPRLQAALFAAFTEHAIFAGLETVLPTHAASSLRWSSSLISLLFLLLVFPTLFSPLVGRLSDRLGARAVSAAGLALAAPSVAAMSFVTAPDPALVALLLVCMLALGLGISGVMTPLMAEIDSIADEVAAAKPASTSASARAADMAAVAYSAFNVAMMSASIVAPLACGFLVEKAGWGVTILALAGLCVLSAAVLLCFLGDAREAKMKRDDGEGRDEC